MKGTAPALPPLPAAAALARARVLVAGDAMLDRYWFGPVERISPEAPVPIVRVEREEERPGGAANVACNVAALGAATTLLSVVGRDEPAAHLRQLLERSAIRAELGEDENFQTAVKLRILGRGQQLLRVDFERAPERETLAIMLTRFSALLPAADALLLSDYGKGGLTHVLSMIQAARAASKPILVDPKGDDFSRYRGASVITPNRAEFALAAGQWRSEAQLERLAHELRRDCEIGAVLLTRSEEGMTLFDEQGAFSIAAEAREVFDVTGAGDAVIAVTTAFLAAGMPLRQSMIWANRAAGIVVNRLGTAAVTYQELQQSLQ